MNIQKKRDELKTIQEQVTSLTHSLKFYENPSTQVEYDLIKTKILGLKSKEILLIQEIMKVPLPSVLSDEKYIPK